MQIIFQNSFKLYFKNEKMIPLFHYLQKKKIFNRMDFFIIIESSNFYFMVYDLI